MASLGPRHRCLRGETGLDVLTRGATGATGHAADYLWLARCRPAALLAPRTLCRTTRGQPRRNRQRAQAALLKT
eukprot:4083419-Pyramimonas_sp.AAC.1